MFLRMHMIRTLCFLILCSLIPTLLFQLSLSSFLHILFVVASMLKRPRSPTNNPAMDYQTADSEHVLNRSRPFGLSDAV